MTKNTITTETKFRVVHTTGDTWIPLYRNAGTDWQRFCGARLLSYYARQASAVRVICARAKVGQPTIDFYDRNVETPVEYALENYKDLGARERELYGPLPDRDGSYNEQRAYHRAALHSLTRYLALRGLTDEEIFDATELRRESVRWLRDHA